MLNSTLLYGGGPVVRWSSPTISDNTGSLDSTYPTYTSRYFGTVSASSVYTDGKYYWNPIRVLNCDVYNSAKYWFSSNGVVNTYWYWKLPYPVLITDGTVISSAQTMMNYKFVAVQIYTGISTPTVLVPKFNINNTPLAKTNFTVDKSNYRWTDEITCSSKESC